jgi:hypothetical protein
MIEIENIKHGSVNKVAKFLFKKTDEIENNKFRLLFACGVSFLDAFKIKIT